MSNVFHVVEIDFVEWKSNIELLHTSNLNKWQRRRIQKEKEEDSTKRENEREKKYFYCQSAFAFTFTFAYIFALGVFVVYVIFSDIFIRHWCKWDSSVLISVRIQCNCCWIFSLSKCSFCLYIQFPLCFNNLPQLLLVQFNTQRLTER